MGKSRDNHYVPIWYQEGFLDTTIKKIHYLDLKPETRQLSDGRVIQMNSQWQSSPSQCFCQRDLYTTFFQTLFGQYVNDDIETKLFGKIDNEGAPAVKSFIENDLANCNKYFQGFLEYIDAQKIRTPKGLDWIKSHYPNLNQIDLMQEMQAIRARHCSIWGEGVREIVSAENSSIKFIVSDHPVTIYNSAFKLDDPSYNYPNDPSIALKGSQTIFPLNMNYCLILTNYEYAKEPGTQDPKEVRAFNRYFKHSYLKTDSFIRCRNLNDTEVNSINFIIKERANRYIAGARKEWLYPEKNNKYNWEELKSILLPPSDELFQFGGEIYIGFENGKVAFQDELGRKTPENKYLQKNMCNNSIKKEDFCGCGSGKTFEYCCFNKAEDERPSWKELSIRERNIIFYNGINDILGITNGKSWDNIREELSNHHIKKIHELYAFLWPAETDFIKLLPKPDKQLRAVYSGTIDIRTVAPLLGLTHYFDEIIIQSPFVNSNIVKEKFNPTLHPHQYKHETLKNLALFFELMPYIDEGYINFIPDPCDFDFHLRDQKNKMANGRKEQVEIGPKDKIIFDALKKDDFEIIDSYLSETQIKNKIIRTSPNLTNEEIDLTIKFIRQRTVSNPLALLQSDLMMNGGQIMMTHMLPNFEMSLFLCQITGSIFVTDSQIRWGEMMKTGNINNNSYSQWGKFIKNVRELQYHLNVNPQQALILRRKEQLQEISLIFHDFLLQISNQEFSEEKENELINKLIKSNHILWQQEKENLNETFMFNFVLSIPHKGFTNNNVQRMLLNYSDFNQLDNLPMAIFIDVDWKRN